ncbi:Kelch domain-containing protein 8B [Durusdinium trenchii]|uniref:Kelch domain-containing protein 8B n=1 Tax=Durusdinium trenchii TaxID=1381693 RepID=A0ABP0JZY4_9DINO
MAASSGGYAAFDRESYRAEIVSIRQESTHVKYCIELRFGEERWQVDRRFRDLFQLHQLLRSSSLFADGTGRFPGLPSRRAYGLGKWIFGKEDDRFIAERQREFQQYLDALICLDPTLSHGALRLFLGLPALPSSISLERALDFHIPEVSWKTPSKVDLRLLRSLVNRTISPEMRARLAEIPLCVVELPGVSRQISQAVGFVGSRSFRAASRSVAQTIQQTLPGLLWCSKIYVLSAWNGRPEALSIFCPSSSRFEKVPLLKHLDPYYAVASRAGNLYVLMSGEDPVKAGIEWRSSFHCWQPAHGQWRRLPSRPGEETTRFALTAAGSAVYALGGIGRRGCSAATDRFDLHRARWEALPPLASPRCDAAAVAKGSVVFLLGGTDRLGEACADVESLDVWSKAWRTGPSLLGPRHSGTATSTSDCLVLFGGSAVARGHLLADAVSPPEPECLSHRWDFWAALPENYEMNTEHQLAGYLAHTNGVLTYVPRADPSHVEPWHFMSIVTGNPLKFFMVMMCFFLPQVAAATEEETMETGTGMFELIFTTAICLLLSTMFLLGRWSVGRTQVTTSEIGVQKEEALVPHRLRLENKRLQGELNTMELKAMEAQRAADEFQRSLNLILEESCVSNQLLALGAALLRACVREMDNHRAECPLQRGVLICRRGRRFHLTAECSSLAGRDVRMQDEYFHCELCSGRVLPPDYVTAPAQPGGYTLTVSIQNWLQAHATRYGAIASPP